jgi:transcription elongation GreA/GreB family factor
MIKIGIVRPMRRFAAKDINMEPIYLTPGGIRRLEEKLARLKRNLPKLAEEAARTAAYGDRSDNAEYKQAKGALRYATFESYRIEDQLKRVVPIEPGVNADGAVRLGSVVTLIRLSDEKELKYQILGPSETNPTRGQISHLSPLGAALIGRREGDVVTIQTEGGEKEYQVARAR